jgi:hypothetical protein
MLLAAKKMYEIDDLDELREIRDLPQSSVGAPIPMLACDERTLYLAYYVENVQEEWDGTTVKVVGSDTIGETVALVKFDRCYAHSFGPPNDEAYTGHPLVDRGLEPYSVFEVINSSWVRQAEKRNSVHPYHSAKHFFEDKHHYIFFFHDSTYECIAKSFTVELHQGSVKGVLVSEVQSI